VLRFLADECFNGDLFRAISARHPGLDIVRAQDVGLGAERDPEVLAWAAEQGRLVLSHDVNTLVGFAYDRTRVGQPMPGVVEVPRTISIEAAATDILILAECSREGEWEGQVIYLPL
jgi:predicted nuclease of predicted toxin-antitoxin system